MTEEISLGLPEAQQPQYRRDPISGIWTLIAPERASRPTHASRASTLDPVDCPFCEGNENATPAEIAVWPDRGVPTAAGSSSGPDTPGWKIRVIPNRYPAVRSASEFLHGLDPCELTSFASLPGVGRHEVVVELPEHAWSISRLSGDHIANIFRIYQRRLLALRDDPTVRFALIFKNAGARAGASQEHAHSQILGTSQIPPMLQVELEACQSHFERTGRGLFHDLIEQEMEQKQRIAAETEHFIAICPFASRFPCEVWVLPKLAASRFEEYPEIQFGELGGFMRSLLNTLEKLLPEPAYNYFLHTAPFDGKPHTYYHWHLEVTPRVVGLAGFELGSGMYINPIPPEWAAAQYRKHIR